MDDKVLRARQLYESLTKGGRPPEDRVLARSPEYREMLALGISLCQERGAAAFDTLSATLYGADDPRSAAAAVVLRHWWAGLSRLYGQDDLGRSRGADSSSANEDYVILSLTTRAATRRRAAKSDVGLTPRQSHPVKLQ